MYLIIGLKFWKVGSRKIYAIKSSDLHPLAIDDSSGSETEEPKPKRPVAAKFNREILKEIKDLKESLLSVNDTLSIPMGLRQVLSEALKCQICHDIMKPPIIFGRCCKYIIGCRDCIDNYYGEEGMGKTCPRCRSDRALADTCKVNGLDELLMTAASILNNE